MNPTPETRASLLIRLKDRADQEAWREFTEIYRPLVLRQARRQGLQDADAEDLAQQVLLSVARAIDRWEANPTRARFRTWLSRVSQNSLINLVTRSPADRGTGDTAVHLLLEQAPDAPTADSQCLRREWQAEVFRWAARRIREEFAPHTWQAFWQTAVLGREIDDVARELGKSPGSIYAARSRIMRRLREVVSEWES